MSIKIGDIVKFKQPIMFKNDLINDFIKSKKTFKVLKITNKGYDIGYRHKKKYVLFKKNYFIKVNNLNIDEFLFYDFNKLQYWDKYNNKNNKPNDYFFDIDDKLKIVYLTTKKYYNENKKLDNNLCSYNLPKSIINYLNVCGLFGDDNINNFFYCRNDNIFTIKENLLKNKFEYKKLV